MLSSPRAIRVFALLCLLAVACAQVFGIDRAYVCLCGGKPMPTQAPHCYGPHGDHCHTNEACSGGSDSESGSGNRKDHQVVNNDVQSRPVGAAAQMVAPQVLLAILPMLFASEETKVPASYCVDFGESPPFGVTVARTIVLLI